MWVGGVADSQTRSKPLKTPQITPKIAVVDPNFIFCSPKSHRNPGVGKQIWERSPLLLGGFENWLPLIRVKYLGGKLLNSKSHYAKKSK